jgi:hypothetical protein
MAALADYTGLPDLTVSSVQVGILPCPGTPSPAHIDVVDIVGRALIGQTGHLSGTSINGGEIYVACSTDVSPVSVTVQAPVPAPPADLATQLAERNDELATQLAERNDEVARLRAELAAARDAGQTPGGGDPQ